MQFKKSQIANRKSQIQGYTLLELVITLTILSIMVLGTIPMAQNAVKRQRELRLRESLRMMRNAIDEFKRDAVGACPQGVVTNQTESRVPGQQQQSNVPADPRSRVVIDDCKLFSAENLDRYPPDLETLVKGVSVRSRGLNPAAQTGGAFSDKNATELNENVTTTKVYLREIPIDPMTGKDDTWVFQSSYQTADSNWDQVNVFDVRSGSDEEAMNGEKYSDW